MMVPLLGMSIKLLWVLETLGIYISPKSMDVQFLIRWIRIKMEKLNEMNLSQLS